MFVILLRFSSNKGQAEKFMEGHMKWLKQGFEDGVFLLAGSIKPGLGGAIMAHNESLQEIKERVSADPFVSEKVVTAEILEIDPAKAEERLAFLLVDKET